MHALVETPEVVRTAARIGVPALMGEHPACGRSGEAARRDDEVDRVAGHVGLAGTIREWTSTWFDERAGTRVVRGGSWALVVSRHFRCATRFGYRPLSRSSVFGFRLFSSRTLPSRPPH